MNKRQNGADMYAHRVSNIEAAFDALPTKGFHEKFVHMRYFSNIAVEHIQGYTQYEGGGHLYYLFTHHTSGEYGHILLAKDYIDADNKEDYIMEQDWEHPGGIQSIGQYLFVPCEKDKKSKIFIYDICGDFKKPNLSLEFKHRAGCLGITDFQRGSKRYYLLLVGDQQKYYAYISEVGSDITQLDFKDCGSIDLPNSESKDFFNGKDINCQGFGLVTDDKENVYMIALMYHYPKDWAYLLKLNVSVEGKSIGYECCKKSHLKSVGGVAGSAGTHFRWGAGIRVTPNKNLVILATSRNIISAGYHTLDTNFWAK